MTWALCATFFVSGGAALLFQTLFFRHAGLLLGNSVWATAIVTASFMGGLAVGNAWAARRGPAVRSPLRAYAALELAVAGSGIGLVLLVPRLAPLAAGLFAPVLETPLLLNGLRLALAFGLLLLPSSAMGATLPLLARALSRHDPSFGRVLGRLYGWNTLGAVAGALAGELLLIETLGLTGTGWLAGALNGLAAGAAYALSRRVEAREGEPAAAAPTREEPGSGRLLAAAFLAGAALLALEGVWFRTLHMFVAGTSLSFAVMLAVVLLGIGAGGLAAGAALRSGTPADSFLPGTALLAGSVTAWSYAALPDSLARFGGRALLGPAEAIPTGLVLMFPTCLLSGALFTLLGAALRARGRTEAAATGALTFANTLGAMLGALACGLLLLPGLGVERTLFGLALAYLPIALLVLRPGGLADRRQRLGLATATVLFAALLGLFPFGLMRNFLQPLSASQWRSETTRIVARREGLTETILYLVRDVLGQPVYHRLVTNSFSMSGTPAPAARYMRFFVYWPVALKPQPKRALLISYGVGVTARALTDTRSLEAIDVVDVSRDILELGRIVFPIGFPLDDPRVRVHLEDGRFFLLSGRGRYDVATGEPPPPKNAGISSLYSREYFRLLRARLAPGGVASYWLPVHQLQVAESRAVVRAFCDAFEDCSLWAGAGLEWVLAGSAGLAAGPGADAVAAQWREPAVASQLREVGFEGPEWLASTFVADAPFLKDWSSGAPALVDDFPLRISSRFAAGIDPEYLALLEPEGRRRRFASSGLVAGLWPPELRERAEAVFEFQWTLDRIYARANGLGAPEEDAVAGLVAGTRLRSPVLHAFLASEREVAIARKARQDGVADPLVDEILALEAVADRDYPRARKLLARAPGSARDASRAGALRRLLDRLPGSAPDPG